MLTVDALLDTIRQLLESEAENPTDQKELILSGIPSDEVMKKVLSAKNGTFIIKICEMPQEMNSLNGTSNLSSYHNRMREALGVTDD